MYRPSFRAFALLYILLAAIGWPVAPAAAADDPKPYNDDPKPYNIAADGTVDWATFNGYRRYNGICYTCHGPDGAGSSFAPSLVDSLKRLDHDTFMNTVVNGRTNVDTANEKRMPSFGTDPNVMCYIDDIYAYLKARSDGVMPRGRPAKHAEKPEAAKEAEQACMGN